jgi:hypothetical protein
MAVQTISIQVIDTDSPEYLARLAESGLTPQTLRELAAIKPQQAPAEHYQPGCGCPRCSYIDAVAAFTAEYTGHHNTANTAYVLADAAKWLQATA